MSRVFRLMFSYWPTRGLVASRHSPLVSHHHTDMQARAAAIVEVD